jgi:hypothetical protein
MSEELCTLSIDEAVRRLAIHLGLPAEEAKAALEQALREHLLPACSQEEGAAIGGAIYVDFDDAEISWEDNEVRDPDGGVLYGNVYVNQRDFEAWIDSNSRATHRTVKRRIFLADQEEHQARGRSGAAPSGREHPSRMRREARDRAQTLDPAPAETVDDPKFENIARLIAGDQPCPDRLPAALQRLAAGLRFAQVKEETHPPRVKMREKLLLLEKTFRGVIQQLADTPHRKKAPRNEIPPLADTAILEHLDAALGETLDTNEVANMLRKLADGAAQAAANIKKGAGQGRAWVGDQPSAKVQCAMIVTAAWEVVQGAPAKPGSRKVQQAALAYWTACGGKETGDEPLEGWRKTLKAIEKYPDDAKRIRQLLIG